MFLNAKNGKPAFTETVGGNGLSCAELDHILNCDSCYHVYLARGWDVNPPSQPTNISYYFRKVKNRSKGKKRRFGGLRHKLSLANFFPRRSTSALSHSSSTETIVPVCTPRQSLGGSTEPGEGSSGYGSRARAISTIDRLIIANRTSGSGSDESESTRRSNGSLTSLFHPKIKSPRPPL